MPTQQTSKPAKGKSAKSARTKPLSPRVKASGLQADSLFSGGGEMGERIRKFDWSKTSLGPIKRWPHSLKTAVRIMLSSRQPIWIGWGKQLIKLYNDPYKSIVGGKHPRALGQPSSVVWRDIWVEIEPMLHTAMSGVEGTYVESALLIMHRNGYPEETHYTFSYTPIPDDAGKPGGIICANTDDTLRIFGERQLRLLGEIATNTGDARTSEEACESIARALTTNPQDITFALIYVLDVSGQTATLEATCQIPRGHPAAPPTIKNDDAPIWPIWRALEARAPVVIAANSIPGKLPPGVWEQSPANVAIMPIGAIGQAGRPGVLIVGLNPFRLFDDNYRSFLTLVSGQISATLANARAYDEERKRAEALAEIDRAKTAFFSNVSHEFRTPLTLLLGPAEEMLAMKHGILSREAAEQVGVIHRNALRLQRLVNTLLDFSRIEAGRIRGRFVETDVVAVTADLASVFRSAMEKAGLKYTVDLHKSLEPVFLDHDMWEKIVFNLLSNAFKFTLKGEVKVSLTSDNNSILLSVSDTGVGIPTAELPNVFKRFYRVEGHRGRTHEGTGIGLALVQELVKLHGGNITVESESGQGSTFRVRLPFGKEHLPTGQILVDGNERAKVPATVGEAFIDEADSWLPEESRTPVPEGARSPAHDKRPRVLLAEDNADMRNYVQRLLHPHYLVETAANGVIALELARQHPPDLVLSDVMMPEMNGFELVQGMRADENLHTTPVILLSARAGEEARVEGAAHLADDYLVKPFSARELLARIKTQLELARVRYESETAVRAREADLNEAQRLAHVGSWYWEVSSDATVGSAELFRIFGLDPGKRTFPDFKSQNGTLYPETSWKKINAAIQGALRTGLGFKLEVEALKRSERLWVALRSETVRDAAGKVIGLRGTVQDISERRLVEEAAQRNRERLQFLTDASQVGVWFCDLPFEELDWDQRVKEHFWLPPDARVTIDTFYEQIHPDDRERTRAAIAKSIAEKTRYDVDYRTVSPEGQVKWIRAIGHAHFDQSGHPIRFDGVTVDVTESRRAETRNRVLVELDDAVRPLVDPNEITLTAVRVLGQHLQVDRCAYAEVEADQDTMNLSGNYLRGPEIKSIVGRLKFFDFGAEVLRLMRENKPFVVDDVDHHHPPIGNLAAYQATQIQAVICVPLHKAGKLVAAMAVHSTTSRHWTPAEVELVSAVAARCWESIERGRLARGLDETERRFRLMADSAPALIWQTDESGVVFVNQQYLDFFGTTFTGIKEMAWASFLHPDDYEAYVNSYRTAFQRQQPYEFQCRFRRHDGEYRWLHNNGVPHRTQEGKFVGFFGSSTDVTQQKRAEQALRESEERFRAFVTTSSDVVYRMNADWSELQQLRGKDFIADTEGPTRDWIEKYIHPEDRAMVLDRIREAIRTKGDFELEHRVVRVDGSLGWTHSRAIPLLDAQGQIREWFGTAKDVTDRRHAEEALREEARVLELLKDTGDAIAAQLDLHVVVQIVTDAATKLCGAQFGAFFYNAINAQGEAYLLYTLSGAPREAFEKFGMPRNTPVFNATFTGQGVVRSADITKDSRYGTMAPHHGMPKGHLPVRSYLAAPVILRSGEVVGGLFFGHSDSGVFTERSERLLTGIAAQGAIAIDNARLYEAAQREITERQKVAQELHKAQEELSHHAEGLEQQVAARTASLREAVSQLEEFSYSVSHDLRAPLRAIAGYNRIFREDYGNVVPPGGHVYLDKISRNAERMERLVNDVLTLSRVARADLKLHPIPLQQFVDDIIDQHPTMQAPAADIEVKTPHTVLGDQSSLGQALSNLLSNAVKFVPAGEKPVVRVNSELRGDRVRVWVEDLGIGILLQHRGKIFDMFQRLPANLEYEGSGIGLAIVRKAVERMGGNVGVEANEPHGSRFWIELKGKA